MCLKCVITRTFEVETTYRENDLDCEIVIKIRSVPGRSVLPRAAPSLRLLVRPSVSLCLSVCLSTLLFIHCQPLPPPRTSSVLPYVCLSARMCECPSVHSVQSIIHGVRSVVGNSSYFWHKSLDCFLLFGPNAFTIDKKVLARNNLWHWPISSRLFGHAFVWNTASVHLVFSFL